MSKTAPRNTSLLVDNYPTQYTVVKGDTLWDISGRFLRDPWLWPQVWENNQQIRNPHLIYPGDIITLAWGADGRPRLILGQGSERLSPRVRYEDLESAIPTIKHSDIIGFLSKPTVMDATYADGLPYVLASNDGRLIMSQGNEIYVRGNLSGANNFNIFHLGKRYIDPESQFLYGHEALFVGEGNIVRGGDPATMYVKKSRREILRGDRLLALDSKDVAMNFTPRPAPADLQGSIMSIVEGLQYIGQYDIVVLNRGANAGLSEGHVISIYQRGDQVYDPYDRTAAELKAVENENKGRIGKGIDWVRQYFRNDLGQWVKLPDEPAGVAMVFRVYDNLSYALVMRSEREIHRGDMIRSPN